MHVAVALASVMITASTLQAELVCPIRECLPEDTSRNNGDTLCYTNTGSREAFASCPDSARSSCERCVTAPPCESWCEAPTSEKQGLGSPCHLDKDCGGDIFVQCHMGKCLKILWAGQRCDANDEHAICMFGGRKCVDGFCQGRSRNQPCWDGYTYGHDLDCEIGLYCMGQRCVPQLPNLHTCTGEHPHECVAGHRCDLVSYKCTREYSIPSGAQASDKRLCQTAHIDERVQECAPMPRDDTSGSECDSSDECVLEDGSGAECFCKRWWDGSGMPGYCELPIPDTERPTYMVFWHSRRTGCHHNWPEDRCAAELDEKELLDMVIVERGGTADPTVPFPDCAQALMDVIVPSFAWRPSVPLNGVVTAVFLGLWYLS